MPALSVLTHHSEPSDPVLLRWMIDTFEAIFGIAPLAVVLPIAIAVVALPLAIGWLAWRARRDQSAGVGPDGSNGSDGSDGFRAK